MTSNPKPKRSYASIVLLYMLVQSFLFFLINASEKIKFALSRKRKRKDNKPIPDFLMKDVPYQGKIDPVMMYNPTICHTKDSDYFRVH